MRWLVAIALLCSGCLTARAPTGEVVLDPDPGRSGASGSNGPNGVAQAQLDVQARVVDTFPIEVFYPIGGGFLPVGTTGPLMVIVQERGVGIERYFWLATHLASRGYPAIVVDHLADSPLAEIDNGYLGLDAVRRASRFNGAVANLLTDDATGVLIGHGEGAKAAQDLWLRYDDFRFFIALEAALSSGRAKADGVALCVAGENDRERAAMLDACASFPFATTVEVEGANHYVFTDSVATVEASNDGGLCAEPDKVRAATLSVIDAWLDAMVHDAPAAKQILNDRSVPGVTFQ